MINPDKVRESAIRSYDLVSREQDVTIALSLSRQLCQTSYYSAGSSSIS